MKQDEGGKHDSAAEGGEQKKVKENLADRRGIKGEERGRCCRNM